MAGVLISEGMQLRIPAGGLALRIGPDGGLDMPRVRFEVAIDVWPFWLDVAIDHASSALQVRKELTEAIRVAGEENVDGTVKGDLLAGECKAGMVAIAASAFALDNFCAVIQRFTPAASNWKRALKSLGRHATGESLRRLDGLSRSRIQAPGACISQCG